MRLIRFWIRLLLLTAMACGPSTFAQDGDVSQPLLINDMAEESALCTSQDALAYYASLDGLEPVMSSVVEIEDKQSLIEWFYRYEDWLDSDEDFDPEKIYCYGVILRAVELERNAKYSVLLFLTEGESAFREQAASVSAREIAGADLAAIVADELPDAELEINRAFVELAPCTNQQAIAFLETLEAYANETRRAADIKDSSSLREWAARFEAWRLEAWSSFNEQPCGVTDILINTYEALTYSFALLRQTRFGDTYVGAMDEFLETIFDFVESDMSAIEAMPDE